MHVSDIKILVNISDTTIIFIEKNQNIQFLIIL